MKGNFHVQFLGEGVAATSPPYPTPGWATTQVYPALPFRVFRVLVRITRDVIRTKTGNLVGRDWRERFADPSATRLVVASNH